MYHGFVVLIPHVLSFEAVSIFPCFSGDTAETSQLLDYPTDSEPNETFAFSAEELRMLSLWFTASDYQKVKVWMR